MTDVQGSRSPAGRVTTPSAGAAGKFGYIDAVRGWAILLVMTCHVAAHFAELPYPVKRVTNFGWHGVQLFFLASAVTLMMSWHRQSTTGWLATRNFFIRRFLRIAPMYYAGALIYFLLDPPASGFDLGQLLLSFAFLNAWTPDWMPTTPGWSVVPGGWSIGVEFTFYALFPILATLLTTVPRALALLCAAVLLAYSANHAAMPWLAAYDKTAVSNFLYFWFPNQAPVFALGILLYFTVTRAPIALASLPAAYLAIGIAVLGCLVGVYMPGEPQYFYSFRSVPALYIAAISFSIFIFALARGPATVFVHPWMRRLGELSFSAYVLHFLFVRHLSDWTGHLVNTTSTGVAAIAQFAVYWVMVVVATVAAATLCHQWIEKPFIDLAHRLTSARKAPLPSAVAAN